MDGRHCGLLFPKSKVVVPDDYVLSYINKAIVYSSEQLSPSKQMQSKLTYSSLFTHEDSLGIESELIIAWASNELRENVASSSRVSNSNKK